MIFERTLMLSDIPHILLQDGCILTYIYSDMYTLVIGLPKIYPRRLRTLMVAVLSLRVQVELADRRKVMGQTPPERAHEQAVGIVAVQLKFVFLPDP